MFDREQEVLDDEELDDVDVDDADLEAGDEGDDGHEGRHEETDDVDGDDRGKDEAEARAAGWKPLSQWKGDKSGWVDAKEFLDQVKPARLRDTLHSTKKELAELKRQRETEKRDFEDRLARLDKMNAKALERQKTQLLGQLKAAQRHAAEAGDIEAFDHYREQEEQVNERFTKEEEELAPKAAPKQEVTLDPGIKTWVDRNPAVRFSGPKWNAAVAFYSESEAENPEGSTEDHLAHVEARLNEVWPGTVRAGKSKNGEGRMKAQKNGGEGGGNRSPQTERSGRMVTRAARAKGWAEIPREERAIMERHVNEGLYKDQAEAAKAYWS
jgi:hypothetical protein